MRMGVGGVQGGEREGVLACLVAEAEVMGWMLSGVLRFCEELGLKGERLGGALPAFTGLALECRGEGLYGCLKLHVAALAARGDFEFAVEGRVPRLLVRSGGELVEPDRFAVGVAERSGSYQRSGEENSVDAGSVLATSIVLALVPPWEEGVEPGAAESLAAGLLRSLYSRRGPQGALDLLATFPVLLKLERVREEASRLRGELRRHVEEAGMRRLAERYPPALLAQALSEILGGRWLAGRLIAEAASGGWSREALEDVVGAVEPEIRVGLAAQLGIRGALSLAPGLRLAAGSQLDPVPRVAPGSEPPSVWPVRLGRRRGLVVAAPRSAGSPHVLLAAPRPGWPMMAVDAPTLKPLARLARRRPALAEAVYVAALRAALEAGGQVVEVPGSHARLVAAEKGVKVDLGVWRGRVFKLNAGRVATQAVLGFRRAGQVDA